MRCIIAIKTGEWPPRVSDVEETEKKLMNKKEEAMYKENY
jgi:hypothetical protein